MHPYILKKAEAQPENVQEGALLLADIIIDPSTWSCEEYVKLLTIYGRKIWYFLHWMTRKGYLPSIRPLRKRCVRRVIGRVLHMSADHPELPAYAGDPDVDVRIWVALHIRPEHPMLEFLATDSAEAIRERVARKVPVESHAFQILQRDPSSDVRRVTGSRCPPVLEDTLTYDYLFQAGLPMYVLSWFRKEHPAGIPLRYLAWDGSYEGLYDVTSNLRAKADLAGWLIGSKIWSRFKAQHSP